jgi:hypothetical protein
MALRPEPLSLAEGKLLGLETALNIARAREFARGLRVGKDGHRESAKVTLDPGRMDELIRDIFLVPDPSAAADAEAEAHLPPSLMNGTSHFTRAISSSHVAQPEHESPVQTNGHHAHEQPHPHQQHQQHPSQQHPPQTSTLFTSPPVARDLSQIWQSTPGTPTVVDTVSVL